MTQSHALSVMKTGAHVFLTGEPGSGKTYTANEYVTYLRRTGSECAVTASTGIAATHIGGMTIHSWSGIGVKTKLEKRDIDAIAKTRYVSSRVKKARTLIIEEISMLPATTLLSVDAVCRKIKQNPLPFGGIQVIFVGDFFQLPPIIRSETAQSAQGRLIKESPLRFAYESTVWKEMQPRVCYLTEQHRQDDKDYLSVLSAIRSNDFKEGHLRILQKRKIEYAAAPQGVPKLFSHNSDVDHVNNEILSTLPARSRVFSMSSSGHPAIVSFLEKSCLSPAELHLKIGAAVMCTKNNQKEGFVNGTLGTIEEFDQKTGYPSVRVRGGRLIDIEPMDWVVEEGGEIRAKITQLPLRLAWAITVHKSQGMSLDAAVVDLSSVFEFGQGYVALSRIRRLAGLYLLGWNERAFQVHPEVLAQDVSFRAQSESTAYDIAADMKDSFTPSRRIKPVKERKKNSYRPWDEEQDAELRELFLGGVSISDLAKEFSRTSGSIRSRLAKFKLFETI
ncbi:AAA family ATPase [Candidatus Uhrbacteria bacterium]|nr:AAA family ATPase [Candidatus Uhrbacteria bacterium]